jgi:hypothetical protein
VHLLSLRAQLQLPPGSTKPSIAATLNEGGAHEATRCCAVLWVPRSAGAQFLAVHYSGNILLYKKVGWVDLDPGRSRHWPGWKPPGPARPG